jgi:hypothetical protein
LSTFLRVSVRVRVRVKG